MRLESEGPSHPGECVSRLNGETASTRCVNPQTKSMLIGPHPELLNHQTHLAWWDAGTIDPVVMPGQKIPSRFWCPSFARYGFLLQHLGLAQRLAGSTEWPCRTGPRTACLTTRKAGARRSGWEHSGISACYILSLRRTTAIRPITPEPNSARLPGSGTVETPVLKPVTNPYPESMEPPLYTRPRNVLPSRVPPL